MPLPMTWSLGSEVLCVPQKASPYDPRPAFAVWSGQHVGPSPWPGQPWRNRGHLCIGHRVWSSSNSAALAPTPFPSD